MKKYTDKEIVDLIKDKIYNKFKEPNDILTMFYHNIKEKFKSINERKPTENEIDIGTLKFAKLVFCDLWKINDDFINSKISKEIIDLNKTQGIEIEEYNQYFDELAEDLVKGLIQTTYKSVIKVIRKKDKLIRN